MSEFGNRVQIGSLTPAQREIGGMLTFSQNRLRAFTPSLIGAYLDAICLGIVGFLFVRWLAVARSSEQRIIKYLMYWLFFTACGSTVVLQSHVMVLFASGFGEYKHWLSVDFVRWTGVVSSCSRLPASCFFLHRAYRLCNNAIWPVIVVAPMILGLVGLGVALAIRLPHWTPPQVQAVAVSATSLELLHDLILTTTISTQLFRSRTGWNRTDQLIRKLLLSFAESQAPPTIIATVYLIITATVPNSTATLALQFYSKVIIICVMAVVLSRVKMRKEAMKSRMQTGTFNAAALGALSGSSGSGAGRGSHSQHIRSDTPAKSQDHREPTTDIGAEERRVSGAGSGSVKEGELYNSTVRLVPSANSLRV